MRVNVFAVLVSSFFMFLTSVPARAQTETPSSGLNRAVDLAKSDQYQPAVELTLKVLPELPVVEQSRAHKLLGYAFRKLDMLPEAWYHLTRYMQLTGKDDAAVQEWLREVEELLKRDHVKVSLNTSPSGATTRINSGKVATMTTTVSCPAVWWFLPGSYELVFAKQGYLDRTSAVEVREVGDSGVRDIKLQAISAKKFSRWPEWTLIGAGIAFGAAGGVIHFLGYTKNEELHDKYWDRDQYADPTVGKTLYDKAYDSDVAPLMTTSYILYGVGGAALLSGILTFALRHPQDSSGKASWLITPWSLPDGGAGATFTFGW